MSIPVTGWPLVPVLILQLYCAVRLAQWLWYVCVCSCVPSSCIAPWLCYVCVCCCVPSSCIAPWLWYVCVCRCVPSSCIAPWLCYLCVCSCVASSCVAQWITVRLCLQLCGKFLYAACLCPQSRFNARIMDWARNSLLCKCRLINQNEVLQEILAKLPNVR
jgi:hypothetical protein